MPLIAGRIQLVIRLQVEGGHVTPPTGPLEHGEWLGHPRCWLLLTGGEGFDVYGLRRKARLTPKSLRDRAWQGSENQGMS